MEKSCSFCKLEERQVNLLIQGPSIWICNSCVELCQKMLSEGYEDFKDDGKPICLSIPNGVTTVGNLRAMISKYHFNQPVQIGVK
ncbi:MAG: hypothetical protein JKY67_15755 [Pseudomonadales bacterium]|nr:hypothetical protein [Pseudomonadales bacterium]